jgi:CheY-like chemotaxis protein
MNVLIVEDDKVLSLMLTRMIEKMGFSIAAVSSNGNDAVQKALLLKPDLILMDIMLDDDTDGIDAARNIKQHLKDVPVIYITGNSDKANRDRANEVGYHDYLIKPLIFDDLVASISKL